MLKNQTVNINWHQFCLNKLKANNSETMITVNFQPIRRLDNKFESIIPHFNCDQQFYTPAFLLPQEQKFYKQNINFEKLKFHQRIQNAQEKSIFQVKYPQFKNNYKFNPPFNYCQICKSNFHDYLQHINQSQHQQHLSINPTNLYIQDLMQKYHLPPLKEKKISKVIKKDRSARQSARNKAILKQTQQKLPKNKKNIATYSKSSNQSTILLSQII